jgi:DNA-directed RNA polymerase specialized sigma24 family protein
MVAAPIGIEGEAVYRKLRSRLHVSAARRVPIDEVDDLVQDTLEKVLREPLRAGAPNLARRAFAALHDKEVELWRRDQRRRARHADLVLVDEDGDEGERPDVAILDDGYLLLEARDLVASIAGEDAIEFALLTSCGATERDVAVILGWPPNRAAAARVQLGRKKAEIALALLDIV